MPPGPARSLNPEELARLRLPPIPDLPSLDLAGLASYIRSGRCRNVVLAAGAGISTAAGIPDFRSPGTGLYDNLQKYNLPAPTALFDTSYFIRNPEPFFKVAATLLPGNYRPCPAHYFGALLFRQGILRRFFTQNIDGLEHEAGVPAEKLVEAHGTFATSHCLTCRAEYTIDEVRGRLADGQVVRCTKGGCGGLVKPDLVFFGDDLPPRFMQKVAEDLPVCDLLIVMGTSLLVQPFASVLQLVGKDCPRVLFNMDAAGQDAVTIPVFRDGHIVDIHETGKFAFGKPTNRRDIFEGGDCQQAVLKLVKLLGWEDDFWDLAPPDVRAKFEPPSES